MSCGSYVDNASKKQLVKYMEQSADLKKSTVYRLEKFIQLKEKMYHTPKDFHEPVLEYVEKNKNTFYDFLFDQKPKELAYNDTEESIFKLSSYGYLPHEEIIITKDHVHAYSDIPRKKNDLDEIKAEIDFSDKNQFLLPVDAKVLINDTIKILEDDWFILKYKEQKLFIHPTALIGTSRLADTYKAKAIWLTVQYFKNYQVENDSYRMIKFLVDEFDININRKLIAGFTFLHYAVQRGDDPNFFMKYILSLKGDINARDTNGNTPLDYALKSNAVINFPYPASYDQEQIEYWKAKRVKMQEFFIQNLKANGAKSGGEKQ